MNEATKAEIQGYVAKWRPRLRLMDWSIAYEWDAPLDKGSSMMTDTAAQYRRLRLMVGPDTKDEGWQTVEKMVLHELCHALSAELYEVAETTVSPAQVGQIERAWEQMTEWLARVVWEAYEGKAWDAEPEGLPKS